ncbi:hypothetical protein COLO4_32060 [Corchorus olitorius]|uniref:Uncharacterized protein n=1 Tax=Corchorus olitorius TaxID=93759 RepID=A0A1R3H222_9ROSI|nr:hypothetical protein COLO4_32060 [Corchorus olitorius]
MSPSPIGTGATLGTGTCTIPFRETLTLQGLSKTPRFELLPARSHSWSWEAGFSEETLANRSEFADYKTSKSQFCDNGLAHHILIKSSGEEEG